MANIFKESTRTPALRDNFWQNYTLNELNLAEWEALCDGCGLCCLIKFVDDNDMVEYTDVACQLLDCNLGLCRDYPNRKTIVKDCVRLTTKILKKAWTWLPSTCAYKRLYLGQPLPNWHYLIAGQDCHNQAIRSFGAGGRVISETGLSDDEIGERVVRWVVV